MFIFQEWREYARGRILDCPPLDISILFDSTNKLIPNLKENQDYALVPEEVYSLLNRWHGLKERLQIILFLYIIIF